MDFRNTDLQTRIMSVVRHCEKLSSDLNIEQRNILMISGVYHSCCGFNTSRKEVVFNSSEQCLALGFPQIVADLVLTQVFVDKELELMGHSYQEIRKVREQNSPVFNKLFPRLTYAILTTDSFGRTITWQEGVDNMSQQFDNTHLKKQYKEFMYSSMLSVIEGLPKLYIEEEYYASMGTRMDNTGSMCQEGVD